MNGPWWYSHDGSGRFDLDAPNGTCYFATDAYAAIREVSRGGPVTPNFVAQRHLCTVTAPNPAVLAATTHTNAARFGVTKELVTIVPYDLPQQWAIALHGASFDGIRHELRHDPRARVSGVSLFGPAGPTEDDFTAEPLTRELFERAGVKVQDIASSRSVTVVD